MSDDTLQRTLLLAQKFVDQTHAEAEAQARVLVADAEERARRVLGEAEQRAKSVTEDTERHLREEITRLESIRTQLAGDVETISRHMENERNRLRGALSDMLNWVDEHVQPAGSLLAQRPPRGPRPVPSDDVPTDHDAHHVRARRSPPSPRPTPSAGNPGREPSAMTAVPVQGNAATGGARAGRARRPDGRARPRGHAHGGHHPAQAIVPR